MADDLVSLARNARGADRAALEALLVETATYLHALARARLLDPHEAEAATADALTRIAGGIGRLRDPQAYPHWAYRILQRCIMRRGGRIRPTVDPTSLIAVDMARGPVQTAMSVERRQVIAAAIEVLPPRLREPVLLHFTCGLAYREIARVLGTGIGTISRRMRKALRRLESTLGDA